MGSASTAETLSKFAEGSVRVPTKHSPVHKDECMLSFVTPVSPNGIFVNLKTLQAFSKEYLKEDSNRTGVHVYYNRRIIRVPTTPEDRAAQKDAKVDKLAIGVEGGFTGEGLKLFTESLEGRIYVVSTDEFVPVSDCPARIQEAVQAIEDHQGFFAQKETATWEEELSVTKHADNLPIDPNFRPCPPNPEAWACMDCGRTANLWMNLSDGFVGCGRKQWGQPETGCEGDREGAAVRHFDDTGRRYPLAVKLKTLSPSGGDVFSYDEDDLVKNPRLSEHLQRLGINLMQMAKTEQSMTELQIDLNKSVEAQLVLQEAGGVTLEAIRLPKPGVVGLTNTGNSCYVSSVLQALFAYTPLLDAWSDPVLHMLLAQTDRKLNDTPAAFDYSAAPLFQLAKVARALHDGVGGQALVDALTADWTSRGGDASEVPLVFHDVLSLKLRMLKAAVAKGHPDFSTNKQQDCEEYLQHLSTVVDTALNTQFGPGTPGADMAGDLLPRLSLSRVTGFKTIDVYRPVSDPHKAALVPSADSVLRLTIPLTPEEELLAKRKKIEQGEEMVQVPLSKCLSSFAATSNVSFRGQDCTKAVSLGSFPNLLVVQLKKFYAAADWTAQKLQVQVPVEDHLVKTLQTTPLPSARAEVDKIAEREGVAVDLRQVLCDEKALDGSYRPFDGSESASAAAASVEETAEEEVVEASAEGVESLLMMGLDADDARRALVATNNNVERAVDLIFSGGVTASMPTRIVKKKAKTSGGALDIYSTALWSAEDLAGLEEGMTMLESMGCDDSVNGRKLLILTKNDTTKIINDLFNGSSFPEQVAALEAKAKAASPAAGGSSSDQTFIEVSGRKYRLISTVTHLGTSSETGHYISHAKKVVDGQERWVRFNDDKLEVSVEPPVASAYLLFFQHVKE